MNSHRSCALALAAGPCLTLSILAPGLAMVDCPDNGPCTAGTCAETGMTLQGDAAPDAGAAYQMFDRPNLSENGHVAYTADTDGPAATDDVIYVDTTLVAREGDPAPGTEALYGTFEPFQTAHQVNAGGEVVYIVSLPDAPASEDLALYRTGTLVAREGQPAPGLAGRSFADFAFAGLADDGTVGFLADLDGSPSDDSVIYFGNEVLYRQGDPVPALPGESWDGNFDELQWNGRGDLLFEGNTTLPAEIDVVVYRRRLTGSGPIDEIVAQEGDEIAASAGPDFLDQILQTALAENGQWGLRANLGLAPPESNGLIMTGSGFSRQEGEPVDDMPGAFLGDFAGLDVNSHGDVLYLADLEGDTPEGVDEGLFLNCCLLLTDGAPVPGLPEGTTFSDLGFEDLALNDQRQIVFAASYTGTVSGDGIFVLACPGSTCPADVSGNGIVDVEDLVLVVLAWGSADPAADVNDDGVVNIDDLIALILSWGPC